jgi:hypothetical protein
VKIFQLYARNSSLNGSSLPTDFFLHSLPYRTDLVEEEEKEKEVGEVVRDTTLGGGGGARKNFTGFEGTQAVPACPSGIGREN